MNAGTPLYEPLASSAEMITDQLPRRSAKEAFFPVCEDIMSYEKEGQKVTADRHRSGPFPGDGPGRGTPLRCGRHPGAGCGLLLGLQGRVLPGARKKTTIVGLACTTSDDACFCTAVGLSPAETKGSDLFLTPLEGGGYDCETYSEKGEALINRHAGTVLGADTGRKRSPWPSRRRRSSI